MPTMTTERWKRVCAIDDVPVLGARVVSAPPGDIAVFRNGDGELFAVLDRCPHRGGPLSQGIVHGRSVTCPLHGMRIDLASGEAIAPDTGCARRYEVRVENGSVMLQLQSEPHP
jgi:nitrite reductase (NADH) small subunit